MTVDKKKTDKMTNKNLASKKPANGVLKLPRQLSLIEHKMGETTICQRPHDGYINATAMCKNAGRLFSDYNRLQSTKEFIQELSTDMGFPISALIQIIKGGSEQKEQGTWVHPDVAINLAQWLSPKFAVQVSKWVREWMSGMVSGNMPPHVKRYMANRAKIPHTHFSMLNEIYLNFIAPLEELGFTLPDNMLPDASTGKMFSKFLRKEGINVDGFRNYEHEFLYSNRPVVYARLYPVQYLPKFREYFHKEWLPKHSIKYFNDRVPAALPYLQAVIASLPALTEENDS